MTELSGAFPFIRYACKWFGSRSSKNLKEEFEVWLLENFDDHRYSKIRSLFGVRFNEERI